LIHAKFCEECGTRLARTCPKCQCEISPSAKFCPERGEQVAAPVSNAVRASSPETYTPKHLAEKILTSKAALEGERKKVTVLFADLKGSMEEEMHLYRGGISGMCNHNLLVVVHWPAQAFRRSAPSAAHIDQ
jgi:hypothetical protein